MKKLSRPNRAKQIVIGQRVSRALLQRAKELKNKMTPAEELLWKHLRANKFYGYHFRRQQVIDGFIVDFYCHQLGLVIELDGSIHYNRKEADSIRDNRLAERNLTIIRFRNEDVFGNLSGVLERIRELMT
jgi:very-short-patch-repair endonuclease